MFYLDFLYFFFVFSLGNKTAHEECMTSRNVSRNICFGNAVIHSYQAEAFNGCYDKWLNFGGGVDP